MATSQRISRGFHRLGIVLAAIPFVVGSAVSAYVALNQANDSKAIHDQRAKLVCAQAALKNAPTLLAQRLPDIPDAPFHLVPVQDLQALGCSNKPEEVPEDDILSATPTDFSYAAVLLPPLGIGLAITLAASLAVYYMIRAIGWVIGGFAAS
jgi:hypothetical protein